MKKEENEFTPYGESWREEIMRWRKEQIVDTLVKQGERMAVWRWLAEPCGHERRASPDGSHRNRNQGAMAMQEVSTSPVPACSLAAHIHDSLYCAALSRAGKVYALGASLLLCGDATDERTMRKLQLAMPGYKEAALLITDPPYNVNYSGAAGKIFNDRLDDASFLGFISLAFCRANRLMRPGAAFYIWHSSSQSMNFHAACRSVGWQVRETLVWVKPQFVLGRADYHYRHEPCLYGWKDGAAHTWNGGRAQSTVLDFCKPVTSPDHPTMKPVALFQQLIANSTNRGDIVLDPFAGSGTTALACARLDRRAWLVEISPYYCDVIRRRYAESLHGTGCDWLSLTPEVPIHDYS